MRRNIKDNLHFQDKTNRIGNDINPILRNLTHLKNAAISSLENIIEYIQIKNMYSISQKYVYFIIAYLCRFFHQMDRFKWPFGLFQQIFYPLKYIITDLKQEIYFSPQNKF